MKYQDFVVMWEKMLKYGNLPVNADDIMDTYFRIMSGKLVLKDRSLNVVKVKIESFEDLYALACRFSPIASAYPEMDWMDITERLREHSADFTDSEYNFMTNTEAFSSNFSKLYSDFKKVKGLEEKTNKIKHEAPKAEKRKPEAPKQKAKSKVSKEQAEIMEKLSEMKTDIDSVLKLDPYKDDDSKKKFNTFVGNLVFCNENHKHIENYGSRGNIVPDYKNIIEKLRKSDHLTNVHEALYSSLIYTISKLSTETKEAEITADRKNIVRIFDTLKDITSDSLYESLNNNEKYSQEVIESKVEKNPKLFEGLKMLEELNKDKPLETIMEFKGNRYIKFYVSAQQNIEARERIQNKEQADLDKFLSDVKNIKITPFESYYKVEDFREFDNDDDQKKISEYVDKLVESYKNARKSNFKGENAQKVKSIFNALKTKDEMTPIHSHIRNRLVNELAKNDDFASLNIYAEMLDNMTGKKLDKKLREEAREPKKKEQLIDLVGAKDNNMFRAVHSILASTNIKGKTGTECKNVIESVYVSPYVDVVNKFIKPSEKDMSNANFMHKRNSFFANKIDQENAKAARFKEKIEQLSAQKSVEEGKINSTKNFSKSIEKALNNIKKIEENAKRAQAAINVLRSTNHIRSSSSTFNNMMSSFNTFFDCSILDGIKNLGNDGKSFLDLSNDKQWNNEFARQIADSLVMVEKYTIYKENKLNRHFGNGKIRYQAASELQTALESLVYDMAELNAGKMAITPKLYSTYIDKSEKKIQKIDNEIKTLNSKVTKVNKNIELYKKYKNIRHRSQSFSLNIMNSNELKENKRSNSIIKK